MSSLTAMFESLSPRDRKLLAGLFMFFGIGFAVLVAVTLRATISDKSSRVETARDAYLALEEDAEKYLASAAIVESAEERMAEFASQPVSAFMESTAAKVGVRSELSVEKHGEEETFKGVKLTRYQVELKRVKLDLALNFIHDVETSGYPLRIDNTHIRTLTISGEKTYNVTLEVAAFSKVENG